MFWQSLFTSAILEFGHSVFYIRAPLEVLESFFSSIGSLLKCFQSPFSSRTASEVLAKLLFLRREATEVSTKLFSIRAITEALTKFFLQSYQLLKCWQSSFKSGQLEVLESFFTTRATTEVFAKLLKILVKPLSIRAPTVVQYFQNLIFH